MRNFELKVKRSLRLSKENPSDEETNRGFGENFRVGIRAKAMAVAERNGNSMGRFFFSSVSW